MDKERAPVKLNYFVVKGSKKGRPKIRWKEVIEEDMLVRGLKTTNAQCCAHVSIKRFGSLRVATRRIWLTRAPVETRDLSSFLRRCYSYASTPVSSRIANLILFGVQACTYIEGIKSGF